ncbi:unnamed protein product [Notodromas monacha]|uniref:C2H2-type domain-containing protein n=1 Tax=Notodromas monacha TaxID=399045 RepID=A0A7R9BPM9_9CRUS|nr:unnamed protein product [Notodromas monacha]CAG0918506.1 unnamed protein product [Notodromas monacha]
MRRAYRGRGCPQFGLSGRKTEYTCDACDRSFHSEAERISHVAEHQKCPWVGCNIIAHPKILDKHINLQHLTGLADRIPTLNTPEEIAKWREERRKNFPTKSNVERKAADAEERKAKGVLEAPVRKFAHPRMPYLSNRGRGRGHNRTSDSSRFQRGRGRGRSSFRQIRGRFHSNFGHYPPNYQPLENTPMEIEDPEAPFFFGELSEEEGSDGGDSKSSFGFKARGFMGKTNDAHFRQKPASNTFDVNDDDDENVCDIERFHGVQSLVRHKRDMKRRVYKIFGHLLSKEIRDLRRAKRVAKAGASSLKPKNECSEISDSDGECSKSLNQTEYPEISRSNPEMGLRDPTASQSSGLLAILGNYSSSEEEGEVKSDAGNFLVSIFWKPALILMQCTALWTEEKPAAMPELEDGEIAEDVDNSPSARISSDVAEEKTKNVKEESDIPESKDTALAKSARRKRKYRRKTQNAEEPNEADVTKNVVKASSDRKTGATRDLPRKPFVAPIRQTLLSKLLANDILRERSMIFQCVKFVVSENFFDEVPKSG